MSLDYLPPRASFFSRLKKAHHLIFLPAAKISGVLDTIAASAAAATEPTTTMNEASPIFWSQGSIDMSTFKDINFSSMDSDLGAAATAILSSSDDDDLAMLSAASSDDTSTTESSSLDAGGGVDDEQELGEFLWNAFAEMDTPAHDWTNLCTT